MLLETKFENIENIPKYMNMSLFRIWFDFIKILILGSFGSYKVTFELFSR